MSDPIIRPAQAAILRAAASVLYELQDDGFIDWRGRGEPNLEGFAEMLEEILSVYNGCEKAPSP